MRHNKFILTDYDIDAYPKIYPIITEMRHNKFILTDYDIDDAAINWSFSEQATVSSNDRSHNRTS